MSDVGAALKARFAGRRTRVVVPELKGAVPDDSRGEPAIYAPPFTLEHNVRFKRFIDSDSPEGFAEVVLQLAENEAGERLFDVGDRLVLMQCLEAHIVKRLGTEIMASIRFEDAKGN